MQDTSVVISKDPQDLLRLLHRVAAISTLLILGLSWMGVSLVYQRYVLSHAEAEAVSISESIVALQKHLLLHPFKERGSQLVVDQSEFAELDQTINKILTPFGILKIKVFSPAGEVVYSTERSIIGQLNPHNERLAIALSGFNDSKLQTKEEVYDLSNEKRFDVDVVETYVPIRNERQEVVGSFEIYQNTTQYRKELYGGVLLSVVILGGVLFVVYSISYIFLRTAVIRLIAVQTKLQLLATSDGLTGLLNHREIMRLAENEFARYIRQHGHIDRAPFSLIMADLDDFKQINDRYGHIDGDKVLRVVADRINQHMRRYSVVGRYGGEEFLVILPEADAGEVSAVAERICSSVESSPVVLASKAINVTLSLGVATVNGTDQSLTAVLLRADKALYQAKGDGKNRVGYCADSSSP